MTAIAALPLFAHDDWGHPWWPIWPILWVAVAGTLVWLIARRRHRPHDPLDRAREVLAERYARGEITGEEYRTRLDDLHGGTR
ncbi:MAG TPA: SHOCT domain-containing protein [Gaiellaceae bacterium]|jgi:putative membrane protein